MGGFCLSVGHAIWFLDNADHVEVRLLEILIILQTLTWLRLVSQQPRDRQVFATLSHKLWFWMGPLVCVITVLFAFTNILSWYETFMMLSVSRFAIGSGVLVMTAAGPLRTAQLPVLGPPLVRALFAEGVFSRARNAVFRRRSSHEGPCDGEM